MMLALRKTPPTDATAWQRRFAALTRWRLLTACTAAAMTRRCGTRSTSAGMMAAALDLFHRLRGTPYDYIGLLGFVLPWNFNDRQRMYCFEWCALAMGLPITARITPERLLAAATQARSSRAFSRPEA